LDVEFDFGFRLSALNVVFVFVFGAATPVKG